MQVYCTAWHEIKQQWRFRKLKKVSTSARRDDEGRIRFTASDDLADQLLLDDSARSRGASSSLFGMGASACATRCGSTSKPRSSQAR